MEGEENHILKVIVNVRVILDNILETGSDFNCNALTVFIYLALNFILHLDFLRF